MRSRSQEPKARKMEAVVPANAETHEAPVEVDTPHRFPLARE